MHSKRPMITEFLWWSWFGGILIFCTEQHGGCGSEFVVLVAGRGSFPAEDIFRGGDYGS